MNLNHMDDEDIFNYLDKIQDNDMTYESGRILGSMCTIPDPIGLESYKKFIITNLGDPGLFKGTTQLESEVISMIGELLHLKVAYGHIVTGGTEANITAICSALYKFKEENPKIKPEIILPRSAHFSFNKIIKMLSLKPVYVDLTDNYHIDTTQLEELINENTMVIVAIAGTTELGYVDDINVISEIAYKHNIPLHVDAAFGGFVIPFLNNIQNHEILFDFKCRGVTSITIDPHKMGLAPIQCGGIIFRNKEDLDLLSIKTPYLTHDFQTTIVGTRSGASTAAIWTLLKHYGMDGYTRIVENVMNITRYTYENLKKIEDVCVRDYELNLLSFNVKSMDVNSLKEELLKYGWSVSVSEIPHAIRLVIMPHIKKEHIDEFIVDLKKIIK